MIKYFYSFLLATAIFLSCNVIQAQTFTGATGAIADNQTWVNFNCTVSGLPTSIGSSFGIEQITFNATHPNDYDLEVHLISPAGTDVLLFYYLRYNGANFTGTNFKSTYTTSIETARAPYTGNFHPSGDLGLFNNGQNPNGIWKLRIIDHFNGNAGNVTNWSIQFTNTPALTYTPVSSNLPIIKINTNDRDIPDPYKMLAQIQVINHPAGQRNFATDTDYEYTGNIGIEIRGSSSATFPKLGWGFQLLDSTGLNQNQVDTPFLGMPANDDWILLSNYADKTLMHNVLSYYLFNQMGHYASRSRYVEVFLNGVYWGNYTVLEKIKRGPDRVNIAKLNPTDTAGDQLTGGYIMKIDKFTGGGGAGFYSKHRVENPTGDSLFVQYDYPKDSDIVPQQMAYMQSYFDSFENALFAPYFRNIDSGYRKFAGEKTFMDYMFVDEVSKNVDGYRLSTFFYKDKHSKKGKIHMGPTWDYDITYMNANYCQAQVDTGWAYNLSYVCPGNRVPAWWERMRQDSLFNQDAYCRWMHLRQHVLHNDTLMAWIDSTVAFINESQDRNFRRWRELGIATWPEPTPIPPTFNDEVIRLKTWIIGRMRWLDSTIYHFPHGDLHVTLGTDTSVCAGSLVLLTPNPNTFSSYEWSTGDTSNTRLVVQSGTYTVTVQDEFHCTGAASIVVNETPPPSPNLGNDTSICAGTTATITAHNGNSYSWNTGATTASISVSAANNYMVTVMSNIGCVGRDTIHVSVLPNPTVNAGNDTSACNGNTIILTASSSPHYLWSTGATTQVISVSATNNYSVTVTDNAGCRGSDTVAVNFVAGPTISLGNDTAVCPGRPVTITAVSSGTQYSWSTGASTTSITVNQANNYTITVTGTNGCTSTNSININSLPVPPLNLGSDTSVCSGTPITLNAGTGVQYLWSTGATGQTISVTTTNTYSVTVTGANTCSAADAIQVTVQPSLVVTLGNDTAICTGSALTLDPHAGTSYLWSTGATTQTITVSSSNTYSVTATGGTGCSGTDAINLVVNPNPVINIGNDTSVCSGNSVSITATGGTQYLWSTGATSAGISVSTANNYSVTVTNGNGCSASDVLNVSVLPNPAPNLGNDTTVCVGNSVTLTASGGGQYHWSTGASTASITVNISSNYVVTVTGSNNCTASDAINVTISTAPTVNLGNDTSICSGNSLTLSAPNGNQYAWSTGASAASISVSAANNYSVTVTNGAGCSSSDLINVSVLPTPIVNLGNDTAVCQGHTVSLNASGGTQYSWSNGATTSTISVTQSNTYTVTVSASGCTASDAIMVTVNPNPIVNLGPDSVVCFNGSLVLTSGNAGSYLWSTGATTQSITVTQGNTYSVTAISINGCSASDAVNITIAPLPDSTFYETVYNDSTYRFIPVLAGATYLWSFGDGSANSTAINPLHIFSAPGTYIVTLTIIDSHGCTSSSSVVVTIIGTSISGIADNTLHVYPNPAHTLLTIDSKDISISEFRITDVLGQQVTKRNTQDSKHETIDVSSFANGVYFISIHLADKTYTTRFVKE